MKTYLIIVLVVLISMLVGCGMWVNDYYCKCRDCGYVVKWSGLLMQAPGTCKKCRGSMEKGLTKEESGWRDDLPTDDPEYNRKHGFE